MTGLVLAVLLAAPKAESRLAGLPAYMTGLEELLARRRRIVELVLQERTDEAQRLAQESRSAALGNDWKALPADLPRARADSPLGALEQLSRFALDMGFAELAVPLLEQLVERGGTLDRRTNERVHGELLITGQREAARQWAVAHPDPAHDGRVQRFDTEEHVPGGSREAGARRALALWKAHAGRPDERLLDRLAKLLPYEGRRHALEASATRTAADPKVLAGRLRELARIAPCAEAYAAWRRLARAGLSPPDTAHALHQMALIDLAEQRARTAIPLLRRAVQMSAVVAPEAQWDLGHAFYVAGAYKAAFEAWRRSETEWPRLACCGRSYTKDYAIWQGLALERMGRPDEAVPHYLVALDDARVASHVLDLYETAGQFEDAVRFFEEHTPRSLETYGEAVPGLTMMVLRRMARADDWPSLVATLADGSDPFGDGFLPGYHRIPAMAGREAVRLLTRKCEVTVPLLLEALRAQRPGGGAGLLRALGACGTPPAIEALARESVDPATERSVLAQLATAATPASREAVGVRGLRPSTPYQPPDQSDLPWHTKPVFPEGSSGRRLPARPTPADHTPRAQRVPSGICLCGE